MPEAGWPTADWLTVGEATARILEHIAPLPTEDVPLLAAVGRTLVQAAISPIDHPPWDNSAMDGFAARTHDVTGASRDAPRTLQVVETVAAGGFPSVRIRNGQATRIMTGAPIPAGADCVVRVEHTVLGDGDTILVIDDMDAGRNIRPRAEDFRAGSTLIQHGTHIRAAEIGVLAAIGCAQVRVYRRPRVAILATGDELVDLDSFSEVAAGRRIVNTNSYALAAAALSTGAVPELLGIARDNADSLRSHITAGLDTDVLVTTAGASVGEHDLVKSTLLAMGLQLAFWRVKMRPGSPFSFGTLPRPQQPPLLVFGLPGNPVSALVTFELFVRPALRALSGRRDVYPRAITAVAAERIDSKRGLTHFLRVKLDADETGVMRARLTGAQGSGMLSSLTSADALLVVPLDRSAIGQGENALVLPLNAGDDAQETPSVED